MAPTSVEKAEAVKDRGSGPSLMRSSTVSVQVASASRRDVLGPWRSTPPMRNTPVLSFTRSTTTRIGRGASSGRGTAWTNRTSCDGESAHSQPSAAARSTSGSARTVAGSRFHTPNRVSDDGAMALARRVRSASPAGSATSMTLSTTSPRAGAAAEDETVRLQRGPCTVQVGHHALDAAGEAQVRSIQARVVEAQRHAGGERVGQVGKLELLGVGDQVLPWPERFAAAPASSRSTSFVGSASAAASRRR